MTVAVDFDGTIVEDRWPEIGELIPGAVITLHRLHNEGHRVILWTCRCGNRLTEAVNFMLRNGLPFDRINENLDEAIMAYGGNSRKVSADMYIDDKNSDGVDWDKIYFKIFGEPIDRTFP